MQITVEIPDNAFAKLAQQRIAELFSDDCRYRDTPARDMVRKIVDNAATDAVRAARDCIAGELPAMAAKAVREAVEHEIAQAAKRGMKALGKLYAGFDPAKLTPEQRAWLEKQIAQAAEQREGGE